MKRHFPCTWFLKSNFIICGINRLLIIDSEAGQQFALCIFIDKTDNNTDPEVRQTVYGLAETHVTAANTF